MGTLGGVGTQGGASRVLPVSVDSDLAGEGKAQHRKNDNMAA